MRPRRLVVPFVLLALAIAASAWAKPKAKKDSESGEEPKREAEAKSGGKQRRDPKGVTGISPYTEIVNKGNAAFVARDFAKAAEIYQDAISKEPKRALAFYHLGEVHRATGKPAEAEQVWQTALKTVGGDAVLHAKILFVLADLRERQGKLEEATSAWKEYGSFVGAHQNAKGYPGSATDRQKVIEVHNDLAAKYAKVRERIEQRIAETSGKTK
jgi:tetratricopeptide (TPR) repeat protein